MSPAIIYFGLDVHKDSITVAVLPADAAAPTRVDRLPNDLPKLKRHCARVAAEGALRICYEASGAGFVLHRALRAWGYHCDVIAPSLIPTKPGLQRKHDRYDATQLARLYRAGELTAVRVPSETEERIRDLVRCRETLQRELLRSRHYLLKFLARRGLVFRAGKHWTQAHLTWLRALAGPESPLETEDVEVLNEYLALFDYTLGRRQARISGSPPWRRRRVSAPRCSGCSVSAASRCRAPWSCKPSSAIGGVSTPPVPSWRTGGSCRGRTRPEPANAKGRSPRRGMRTVVMS